MERLMEKIRALYTLEAYVCSPAPGHEGGRNLVYICSRDGENKYALRVSEPTDRTEEDYLAETEFVHYLAMHGAPVADVIPSARGRLIECIEEEGKKYFISLFAYARGILFYTNGYRYREGAPLEEYFYNAGKALGAIHRLSKQFRPAHRRPDFFDKYNMDYIDRLIPDAYSDLKKAIAGRLEAFRKLPLNREDYGLVHFDYSDINFHIDMGSGEITVFDFDNCVNCWYMFDLAHIWVHGDGWCQGEPDPAKRMDYMMHHYFSTILDGYRSETDVPDEMLEKLPLFIDMVLIENVVDEFECCARENEEPDDDYTMKAMDCLIRDIPYAGVGEK